MEILVTAARPNNSYADYANNALRHALGSARIAQLLEKHNKVIEDSEVLTYLFGKPTTILSGPSEFGGAIKGYALIGYLEYHQANRLKELRESGGLEQAKKDLLTAKGLSHKYINEVDDVTISLWVAYRDNAMVAPTSGSFGFTAYDTVRKLRELSLEINGEKIPLFNEGEAAARAWVPAKELAIMAEAKLAVVEKIAKETGCDIHYWRTRDTRDHYALLDALVNGDYFCPTNPKNIEEIALLLDEVVKGKFKGQPIFDGKYEQMRLELVYAISTGDVITETALKRLGVEVKHLGFDTELIVNRPCSAGRYGLMLARLDHWENLLSWDEDAAIENETFNQPSIGATLAAAAEVDRLVIKALRGELKINDENKAMLKKLYPNVFKKIESQRCNVKMKLYATPDGCNVTLCDQLGIKGDRPETKGLSPANGLGTITPGKEAAGVLANCKATSLQNNYLVATKPWMVVSQALIFLHEVQMGHAVPRLPEEAGAASLAGYLREKYKTGEVKIDDIAFALRSNGFDLEVFEVMLANQYDTPSDDIWSVLYKLEEAHGEGEKKFVSELHAAFIRPIDTLMPQIKPVDGKSSITFYSTGYNGTQNIAMAMQTSISRKAREILLESGSAVETSPLKGGEVRMKPLMRAINRFSGAAIL